MPIRLLRTKVVGVTYTNNDGTSRQSGIRKCRAGDELILQHNPLNSHDANAIEVRRKGGHQLGHVKAELAAEFVEYKAKGYKYRAFVQAVTGPGDEGYVGCNLCVAVILPGTSGAEWETFRKSELEPIFERERLHIKFLKPTLTNNSQGCAPVLVLLMISFAVFLLTVP